MKKYDVPCNILGTDFTVPVVAPNAITAKLLVKRQIAFSIKVTGEAVETGSVEPAAPPAPKAPKPPKEDKPKKEGKKGFLGLGGSK